MGKWRAVVLVSVHVLIGLHIAHWLSSGETVTPVEPSEAMAFSRSSIVNAGLIFFAAMILLTAVFGRFFCGWGCHVVALQDFCRHLMLKVGITPKPLKSRVLAWVPALAFLYMFVWPLVYRLWLGDSLAVRGAELTTAHFWATFPGWVVGILTLLVCGFACVYFLGSKGFCTYACPYGAIFAAADQVAPMRIRVTDACNQCGHCTAVCTSNVRVHEEVRDWAMVVSAGCMKCQDCVSVCPTGALYYGVGPIPLLAKPRVERSAKPRAALNWGDELILASTFVVSFLIVRGLYGVVPFLMSLGVAGVLAFFALTCARLVREPTVERSGWRLKHGGKLLPQGRVFVAVVAALVLMLGHAAVLQTQTYLGDRAYASVEPMRRGLLAAPGKLPEATHEFGIALSDGTSRLLKVASWGWLPTLGNEAKLAWFHALSGDNEESEQAALRAIERDELPSEMYQLLAHLALLRGDHDAAIGAWQHAIGVRPDLPEAYLAMGIFIAQSGDVPGGQSVFDRGLEQIKDAPALYYNAGLARALSGQTEASIALFEQALALNPRYLEARENLAGTLAALGRYRESVDHFRIAAQQAPEDMQTRLLLARALREMGASAEAATELRAILASDPSNYEARILLDAIGGDIR
jgi:tetratricopeptide (TPR) repeat protein/NAD-dependent dihydropyrimidine dehydrogenase PreA subunit